MYPIIPRYIIILLFAWEFFLTAKSVLRSSDGLADLGLSNLYGTHPIYLETRYMNSSSSLSHGVYARNAHGQEWLLRENNITYRTLGGSFDFYFLSGPTAKDVIAQYQGGIIGYPAMQMYWTFGFHQCRWGYQNWSIMQDVVDSYANAGIQLETVWNDIDCNISSFGS